LLEPDPSTVPELVPYVPHFSLLIDDLAHLSNEDIRDRALDLFPMLALWALRDSRDPEELLRNLEYWSDAVRQTLRAPEGIKAVSQLLRYFYLVIPKSQHQRFRAKMLAPVSEVQPVEQTIGERSQERRVG